MSQARKIVDKFQSDYLQKLEGSVKEEDMPFEEHFFDDIIGDFEKNLREEVSCEEFKILPFSMGIRYVEDLRHNFTTFIDQKKRKNSAAADNLAKTLTNSILEKISSVEEMSESSLRSPLIMDNVESNIVSLLQNYYQNISG
jgi:hypothetical protein